MRNAYKQSLTNRNLKIKSALKQL